MRESGGRGPSFLDWMMIGDQNGESVSRMLRQSSVVFTHCGQNALAEVAASRVPAVLVPEDRPHDEQHSLAWALAEAGRCSRAAEPGRR